MTTITVTADPKSKEDILIAIETLMLVGSITAEDLGKPAAKKAPAKKAASAPAEQVELKVKEEEYKQAEVEPIIPEVIAKISEVEPSKPQVLASTVDADTLRASLVDLARTKGREVAVNILQGYNAKTVNDLAIDKYNEVYMKVRAALKGEEVVTFTAEPVVEAAQAEPVATQAEVLAVLKAYAKKYNRKKASEIINKYGYITLNEVPSALYSQIIQDCKE
jgi:hypothetical protein